LKRTRSRRPPARLSTRYLASLKRALRSPPREAHIAGEYWSAARVQRLLRKRYGLKWSARYAVRRLRQAGVQIRLRRARPSALTHRACESLRRTLARPPRAAGLAGERGSRARIASLIERRFGKHLSAVHAGRLAHRLRRRGLGTARDRRLTGPQARMLRELLLPCTPKDVCPAWTRSTVAQLITERLGVRYHPQSIPALLRRWGIDLTLFPAPRGQVRPSPMQLSMLGLALTRTPAMAGIRAARWEQRHIRAFILQRFGLAYPVRGLRRRLSRWGVEVAPAHAGNICALTQEQRLLVSAWLSEPPIQAGYVGSRWTRVLVAQLILDRFDVTYSASSIPQLLRRIGRRLRPTAPVLNGGVRDTLSAHNTIHPTSTADSHAVRMHESVRSQRVGVLN
jgi:transposase